MPLAAFFLLFGMKEIIINIDNTYLIFNIRNKKQTFLYWGSSWD